MTLGLTLYDLGMVAARPGLPFIMRRRLDRGKEDAERISERYGRATIDRPAGPLIWFHGASVGECNAIMPLLHIIRQHFPGFVVLLTSGTVTSARLMRQRLPEGVIHQFVPLDAPKYVSRFLDHWKPDVAVFVESEIWPNILRQTRRRGTALFLVNARMSERSAERWSYAPNTARHLLSHYDLCLAQSEADAQRLVQLGAAHVAITGNLKFDVAAPPVDEQELKRFLSHSDGRVTWVAASTHQGEEILIAEAHRRLISQFPDLLTVIVPRHPDRGQEIADTVSQTGETISMRSHGQQPRKDSGIYIADTLGELGLFYRAAPVSFIGGSFIPHGGQNPIEAAKLGSVLTHGPHVTNFSDIYTELDSHGGAFTVDGPAALAATVGRFLTSPERMKEAARAALETVERLDGAVERTLKALEPYLANSLKDAR